MRRQRSVLTMLLVISICFSLLLISTYSVGQQKATPTKVGPKASLSYVTLPMGSSNYTISVGQSQLVGRRTNMELVVQPATGAVAVPRLVGAKEALIGLSVAQTLSDAYQGVSEYKGKKHSFIRILQSGHEMPYGIVTHTGTGIKTIPDLKGRKFSCNILTSNVGRHLGVLSLKAYGLDVKDVTAMKSENNDTGLLDLIEGRTEATVCSLSGAKMEDLATKVKPVLLPFDPAKIGVIQQGLPAMIPAVSKKLGTIPAGVPIVATPSVLFAHQELDDQTAYLLVKTLVENSEELKPIHRDFTEWTAKNAVKKISIPYHPGAIKFYKEAGLWSPEMDKAQAEALK